MSRLLTLLSILPILTLLACSSKISSTDRRIKIIIDADTANEVDDLFALVGAMASDSFDIKGITSAQFHTSPLASDSTVLESQKMNEELVRLVGRTDISLPLGANDALESIYQPNISAASTFIVDQANSLSEGDSLVLVILGSCTNVASAILQDPGIIPKVRVHYLGIWHNPETNEFDKKEFNSNNDTLAVDLLLSTHGLDLTIMSATTSQYLVFDKQLTRNELANNGELGEYLMNRWDTFFRWWKPEDTAKKKWIMWDVAILESIANPDLAEKKSFLTPADLGARPVTIYSKINETEMEERYWKTVDKLIKK
ncbi:MAG: purine nucleosidase [Algoriphagus sp.]|jgi:purine nucleosidase